MNNNPGGGKYWVNNERQIHSHQPYVMQYVVNDMDILLKGSNTKLNALF